MYKLTKLFVVISLMLFSSGVAKERVLQPEDIDSITILASTSLAVPISELCKIYSKQRNIDVNAVFNSSSELVADIEDGEPADIIITPSQDWFNKLLEKGLIERKTKKLLAKNKLVIATASNMNIAVSENIPLVLDSIYNKALMVIASKTEDALGSFTIQALTYYNMWEKFSSRVVLTHNALKTVDLIIKDQSAGIVFYTDAKLYHNQLKIAAHIPQKTHKPIEYFAAIVVGKDTEKAKKLLDFLASSSSKQIFKKYGFVVE